MDSSEILSKIKMGGEDERGGISWDEEVEMEMPLEVVKKKLFKKLKKLPETVREFLRHPASHPYEMRLGNYLVMREGEEGMRRLRKLKGYTLDPDQMEKLYVSHVERKPGECINPVDKFQDRKFNVEALEEQAVKKLIRGWEAGLKIITRRDPVKKGKKYYVVLHAMKPGQKLVNEGKQAAKVKEQESGTDREPRSEVSCFSDNFRMNILMQVPGKSFKPVKDQPKGPDEAIRMEKNVMKEQKKLARAKRHDERRAKSKRIKRSRPSARKARQEAQKLRDVARAARRQEKRLKEAPVKPEEMERFKPKKSGKHDPPLVDDTVKKILTRASIKSAEKETKERWPEVWVEARPESCCK